MSTAVKEKYGPEYPQVRRVTRKDRKTLSQLIEDFAEKSGSSKLTEMVPQLAQANKDSTKKAVVGDEDKESESTYELIKSVLSSLIEFVEDDVTKWFMELLDVKDIEKYDELPFDIEVYVVDKLLEQKGFNRFFTRASALYKKIRG